MTVFQSASSMVTCSSHSMGRTQAYTQPHLDTSDGTEVIAHDLIPRRDSDDVTIVLRTPDQKQVTESFLLLTSNQKL